MTAPLKLCKDCKWYKRELTDPSLCTHPKSGETHTDLVEGNIKRFFISCWSMRCKLSEHGGCGNEGKLWEAK